MHHFAYRDGSLHAEGVDLQRIAAEVGTPVYVYSSATIERHYKLFEAAMKTTAPAGKAHVFYAMKANGNLGVLKTLGALGAGIDTVSEGEVRKALAAGIPPEKIVFSGVGKSEQELRFAVEAGLYQVNIESESELDLLSKVASQLGKRQEAVLRVNPDIGAGGHEMCIRDRTTTAVPAQASPSSLDDLVRILEDDGLRTCLLYTSRCV